MPNNDTVHLLDFRFLLNLMCIAESFNKYMVLNICVVIALMPLWFSFHV